MILNLVLALACGALAASFVESSVHCGGAVAFWGIFIIMFLCGLPFALVHDARVRRERIEERHYKAIEEAMRQREANIIDARSIFIDQRSIHFGDTPKEDEDGRKEKRICGPGEDLG